jgi:VacB/RNase II family 3'-5' exoribonuclease
MPAAAFDLHALASRALRERDLDAEFPPAVAAEAAGLKPARDGALPDQRDELWCSIDNDDSRDLDQLTVGSRLPSDHLELRVAIADVDALVPKGSAIDRHAARNTTSVYTAGGVFPMLPERLSNDLTSLNPGQERLALVVRLIIDPRGGVVDAEIVRARVRNQAQLAYRAVGAWIAGSSPPPPRLAAVPGLAERLMLQDEATERLRQRRIEAGALELELGEARPVLREGEVIDLLVDERDRAKDLIADAMIASNGAIARYLEAKRVPALRRVVRVPQRWDRIVELAAGCGHRLPAVPDAKALGEFLHARQLADPGAFTDLSLAVVKLIGKGEYVVARPGEEHRHFGLAVRAYAHSTAPNRRYPDLVTQRLVKATIAGAPIPYDVRELDDIAAHCTEQEDAAAKVERRMRKSAAALLLRPRLGQTFDGVVTGAAAKGTWVRIPHPAVEGRVMRGESGLDVGDRVRVRLLAVDIERGFIDFAAIR